MSVIIGVDPHKASHTAVAISGNEEELTRREIRAGGSQVAQLMAWAEHFKSRTWAIESAGGLGYLLARQLVAAGEVVVDVPATLASARRSGPASAGGRDLRLSTGGVGCPSRCGRGSPYSA